MPDRAAIYIRVSTEEQSASAEAQEQGARDWCARKGFVIVEVYRDVGVSGAEWQARAGILRLELDAKRADRSWDLVVCMFQDRLGRDPERVGLLLASLHERRARVFEWARDAEVRIDTMGRMWASMLGYMAAHEREMAAARTRSALEAKARRGLVVGGAVYGYVNERAPDGVRYRIHEGQADVVRAIYQRAVDGDSARTIAHSLNARAIPSPRCNVRGTGSWATSEVHVILRNERYKGVLRWGRKGSEYIDGHRTETTRDDSEVIAVTVPELAIVDAETWEAAQENSREYRSTSGRVTQRGPRARYLLVGNAVCGACGGPIGSGRTSRNRVVIPSYLCFWHRERGAAVCEAGFSRPCDVLDELVFGWMHDDLLDEALIVEGLELRAQESADVGRLGARIEELQAQERGHSAAVKRLSQAIAMGAGDVPELVALLGEENRGLTSTRAQLAQAAAPRSALPAASDVRAQVQRARLALAWARTERPDLLRDLLAACLVGRLRVIPTGPRGRLLVEGEGAPGALLSAVIDGEQGTRVLSTTPTAPVRYPCRSVPISRAA